MDRRASAFVVSMVREAVQSLESARLALDWASTSAEDQELARATRQAVAEALQLASVAQSRAVRLARVASVQAEAAATAVAQALLRGDLEP